MKKLPTATVDDVLSWHPCSKYDRDRLTKLAGKKQRLTALDILSLRGVSVGDKLWVVLRNHFLDDKTLRLFAADCAEHVLHIFEKKYPGDKRPREAIDAARQFARGEITQEQLAASAAYAAYADAASAAYAAAADAAYAAAAAADYYAAYSAYAADKERSWQVARLRQYVRGTADARRGHGRQT